jgi:hypothetical protein
VIAFQKGGCVSSYFNPDACSPQAQHPLGKADSRGNVNLKTDNSGWGLFLIIMSKPTISQLYRATENPPKETPKTDWRRQFSPFIGRAMSVHSQKHHNINL